MLATYNGAEFLDEQLRSIAVQTTGRVDVLASDDRSSDQTRELLSAWARKWNRGRFSVVDGPRQGFAENFRSLILRAGKEADYYAFSDQDDIWDANKFECAVAALGESDDGPALFCSRSRTIGATGRVTGHSRLFRRKPAFGNALVQSIAGANTMVMNRTAFEIVHEGSRRSVFTVHDWWSYQLISGAGGKVIYSAEPHISYRQHGGNLIGENMSLAARLNRILQVIQGRFRRYTDQNVAALEKCLDLLTPANREIFEIFRHARKQGPVGRMLGIRRAGIQRQTRGAQVALYAAALMRWI